MVNTRLWIAAAWALAVAPAALAAEPAAKADNNDAVALAAKIDQRIAAGWEKAGVKPAAPADDAEFLRRVYLDIGGRIPSVSEARAFLKDTLPDKRQKLVDKLLDSPQFVRHFASFWQQLLLPEDISVIQVRALVPGFEAWVRKEIAANVGYDQLARDLLTAPINELRSPQEFTARGNEPSAMAYYVVKDLAPENLAANSARVFLGIRVECAQCHHHPFASWKREQFWGYAAFFGGVARRGPGGQFAVPGPERLNVQELKMAGTDKVVKATFLDGAKPEWKDNLSGRKALADWMTKPDNPYFARAGANRMWYYFFSTGLIDPVDEMVGAESQSNHPELLDEMAKDFVAHKFDLKYLIRAITASKAYQLSSHSPDKSQDDAGLFARMPVRGMTAAQLFDSLAEAISYREGGAGGPRGPFGGGGPRAQFLNKFANQGERPTEIQASILQALSIMNSRLVADATSLEGRQAALLEILVNFPGGTTASRVETLYLATLSRKPTAKEGERMIKYVETGGSAKTDQATDDQKNIALADVFWVLLNSVEFSVNH
jgi:hypothetical protein